MLPFVRGAGSLHSKIGDNQTCWPCCVDALSVTIAAAEHEADLIGIGHGVSESGGVGACSGRFDGGPVARERRDDLMLTSGDMLSGECRVPTIGLKFAPGAPIIANALKIGGDEPGSSRRSPGQFALPRPFQFCNA